MDWKKLGIGAIFGMALTAQEAKAKENIALMKKTNTINVADKSDSVGDEVKKFLSAYETAVANIPDGPKKEKALQKLTQMQSNPEVAKTEHENFERKIANEAYAKVLRQKWEKFDLNAPITNKMNKPEEAPVYDPKMGVSNETIEIDSYDTAQQKGIVDEAKYDYCVDLVQDALNFKGKVDRQLGENKIRSVALERSKNLNTAMIVAKEVNGMDEKAITEKLKKAMNGVELNEDGNLVYPEKKKIWKNYNRSRSEAMQLIGDYKPAKKDMPASEFLKIQKQQNRR